MLTYVYLVKCPNCEDEFFDFFDEAKEYALGCLTKKPIITQTEVNRNDFGECIEHCDLGTIWSWEDMMNNTDYKADDFCSHVLCKADLEDIDSEFDVLDNSIDVEIDEISDSRKPIPEGMTIEELVEAMEENEDTVECTKCGGLFEKAACHHNKEGFGWSCSNCDPTENLVEATQAEMSFEEIVKDSINHLTNDLGKDPWADDFADDVIADIEDNYDIDVPEDVDRYNNWCSFVACEVSRQVNRELTEEVKFNSLDKITLHYEDIGEDGYDHVTFKDEVVDALIDMVTEEELQRLSKGRFNTFDEINDYDTEHYWNDRTYTHEWSAFLENNFDELLKAHEQEVLDSLRGEATKAWKEAERKSRVQNAWLDDADYKYHSYIDSLLDS